MTRKRTFQILIDPLDHDMLKKLSAWSGVPMTDYIRNWIRAGLYGEQDKPHYVDTDLQRQRREQRDEILSERKAETMGADDPPHEPGDGKD